MKTLREPTPTWAHEIEGWLTALQGAGRSPETVKARRQQLRMLARWAGRRGPWSLSTDDLLTWMASRDWCQERRRSVRTTLQGFYRWGLGSERTEHDPALRLPKVRAAEPRPRPCDDEVLQAAVQAAPPRDVLMLRLAAECGLRRGEVAQVHTRDVIPGSKRGEFTLIVHGKGSKEREVPLPELLARELMRRPRGFIFPGRINGHLSARWVGRVIGGWLDQGYTMHSLRHWFATYSYEDTKDLLALSEVLGHASPETTRRYVKTSDARARVVVGAASARFSALQLRPAGTPASRPFMPGAIAVGQSGR
jgi:integrase/recombinase XerC